MIIIPLSLDLCTVAQIFVDHGPVTHPSKIIIVYMYMCIFFYILSYTCDIN